jgi:hypothetical protein
VRAADAQRRAAFRGIMTAERDEIERLKKLVRLAELRLHDLEQCAFKTSHFAERYTRRASIIRIAIICLGALVATKGVIDRIAMTPGAGDSRKMIIEMAFMAIGVCISIAAGLEAAFRFERRSAGLLALASRCYTLSRRYMSVYDIGYDSSDIKRSIRKYQTWIEAHNEELATIYYEAASLGLNLVTPDSIGYGYLESSRDDIE